MLKRRWLILLGLVSIITVLSLYVIPVNFFFHKQALPAPELKKYAYYQIIDEATGQTLMYVPIAVSLDDELVSETNKRYQIIRIEENRAYARFIEDIDIKKYRPIPNNPK